LKRLENMTRYRPIHVQALFLGAESPAAAPEYLYSAEVEFRGEGLALLRALGIDPAGKSVEAVLKDFQRRGYLLAHILECPGPADRLDPLLLLLQKRSSATRARIRRSLQPKRLVLLGRELAAFAETLTTEFPGVEIVRSEQGTSFLLDQISAGSLGSALGDTVVASL
jgi:hypothetical protein